MTARGPALVGVLRSWGIERGSAVALVVARSGIAVAAANQPATTLTLDDAIDVGRADAELHPRWVVWSPTTASRLLARGVRLSVCWDLTAVHALLHGEWRADAGRVWARAHGVAPAPAVRPGPADLFSQADDGIDPTVPVRSDGSLGPEWVVGRWEETPDAAARWAEAALSVADRQHDQLAALADHPMAASTARAESTAELLCAELGRDGLPIDVAAAEDLLRALVGPRPRDEAEAAAQRTRRDEPVLAHAPPGTTFLLRNPAHVKALLRACGVEASDTRAWRLESLRHVHPVVEALLEWRKAERIDTTFGYRWLDANVGDDGRLRGEWTGSDGAAGRMTASAGLHNLPADLRPAIAAEDGHVFVRADLGQIEPRVLAAVSGDGSLVRATESDDLYLPVARDLGVDRATAKVAVLGAMYGQTTGHGAAALRRLDAAYPVAMGLLHDAAVAGQVGRDVRTWGGRLVRLSAADDAELSDADARRRAAARGRYARNALIQGAAAELFKVWAVTVRARAAAARGRIVLCLHDELLVHAPADRGEDVAAIVRASLDEAAQRWAPGTAVRFVADVSIIRRWSDAKA